MDTHNGFTLKLSLRCKVSGTYLDLKVKFSIINNVKPGSLYSDGMKPCVWTESSKDWEWKGENISYFWNDILWNPKQV